MRIYLGIGFLIFWLLAPAQMAVADTATIHAVTPAVTSPSQPALEEDFLNLQD